MWWEWKCRGSRMTTRKRTPHPLTRTCECGARPDYFLDLGLPLAFVFTAAHRFRCAATIRARPAALSFRRLGRASPFFVVGRADTRHPNCLRIAAIVES